MFGSNKKKEPGKTSISPSSGSPKGHSLNSLVEGTTVEGTIKSKSDIRVDGTIKGNLTCDAKVIIGPTGHIDGEIKCKNAVIEGRFDGILSVEELLNIRESAKVSGEVGYGKLIVASGAIITGTYKVAGQNSNGHSKTPKNLVKGAKSSDAQNIAGKSTNSQKKQPTNNPALRYMGMAFQMAIIIGIGTFIGKKIDEKAAFEKPWFTVLFALVFLFIAFYVTLKDLIINKK